MKKVRTSIKITPPKVTDQLDQQHISAILGSEIGGTVLGKMKSKRPPTETQQETTKEEGPVMKTKSLRHRLGKGLHLMRCAAFGDWVDLHKRIPVDCDVIVVCRNDGTGLVPFRLLLPYQLQWEDVQQVFQEFPDTRSLTVIPARACEYVGVIEEV